MYATVINPFATGFVYLLFAVPLALIGVAATKRLVVPALAASLIAMITTTVLRNVLPFNYWAHANDFIIEPFFRGDIVHEPVEGALSALFHFGMPLLIVLPLRGVKRTEHATTTVTKTHGIYK